MDSLNAKIAGKEKQRKPAQKCTNGLPLVSIITPVFNALHAIENNIENVRLQTYPHKEHIIIDGGSTDGTVDILQKNDAKIEYWISEPDAGIYDAMNKGIDAASGKWLYFMGVDDILYGKRTLSSVINVAQSAADADLILGNVLYSDDRLFRSRLGKRIYLKNTIHHQGAFYRRSVFDDFRYGRNELSGKKKDFFICGDYQLNMHLFIRKAKHVYINEIIARCGKGISLEGKFTGYLEEIIIRHLYMNTFKALFFDILTLLRYGWKKIDFGNYC